MIRAALVQMDATPLDPAGNFEKILGFLEQEAIAGADLVIFPELSNTGYVEPLVPGGPFVSDVPDYASALEIQDKLMPLHNAIFTEPGLVGVKYAMARLGLCSDEVRLPLVPLTDATKALVDHGLQHAGLLD